MKKRLIWVVLLSSGCAWFSTLHPAQEDLSIRFPNFHERLPTLVGEQEQLFEMDGATLKAITIAANDFAPPRAQQEQCEVRRESQRYRALRQGDIIFVEVFADPAACGRKLLMLDWGAKYAIRSDGRILRRLFEGEPDDADSATPDGGAPESRKLIFPESQVGGVYGPRATALPSGWFDAGPPPDSRSGPTPLPVPAAPDAG